MRDCRIRQSFDKNRFEGCIHCSPGPPRVQKVFVPPPQGGSLPIQVTGLWPERCASNILETNALCFKVITSSRYSSCVLPSRYLCTGKSQGGDEDSQPISLATVDKVEIFNQLREERPRAETYARISGLYIQYEDNKN